MSGNVIRIEMRRAMGLEELPFEEAMKQVSGEVDFYTTSPYVFTITREELANIPSGILQQRIGMLVEGSVPTAKDITHAVEDACMSMFQYFWGSSMGSSTGETYKKMCVFREYCKKFPEAILQIDLCETPF